MPEENETPIAIIGAGTMGRNIALDLLLHGQTVSLFDSSATQLADAETQIQTNADIMEQHGFRASNPAWSDRLALHAECAAAVSGAKIVIEAIPEDLDAKLRLFRELDSACPVETILASNTSSFVPSRLASRLIHPERLLVAHFWNPAHLIPLVELVPHPGTRPDMVERMRRLLAQCGKHPVVLRREVAGFLGNRLAFALQREAMDLVARGIADAEEIDAVARFGFGRRLPVSGIFGTADLGGLDVYLEVCKSVFPDLCARRDPPEALVRLVKEGRLGVKSDAGWRAYGEGESEALRAAVAAELIRWALRDRQPPSDAGPPRAADART